MPASLWRVSLLLACLAVPSIGRADCIEDRHVVTFDREAVQFRSYSCQVGNDHLRVEFDRFGALAAGTLVANKSSKRLREVVGTPRIIENDVSATFASLLQKFGRIVDPSQSITSFAAEAAGAGGSVQTSDTHEWAGAKVLDSGGFYPAVEEIDALRTKTIPPGLKYFYNLFCKDGPDDGSRPVCRDFDSSSVAMTFWRSMRDSDVTNFPRRINAYNARYMTGVDFKMPVATPTGLRLASYLAGDQWPDEFAILYGTADEDGCDAGFSYSVPVVMLDTALIENDSDHPVNIDAIIGGRSTQTGLRVASTPVSTSLAAAGTALSETVGTLAAGEKAVVPLRIILGPEQALESRFGYRQTSSEIYRRRGANGFKGNVGGFGAPTLKTYAYGPEVAVAAFSVNGNRVELRKRSANFMEVTMAAEEGSCPRLLSWDEARGDWIDHGKVLDKAASRDRQYTEVRAFTGFKGRFRLEEREPESAFIDQVALTILLSDGRFIALKPANSSLAARDDDMVRLPWGGEVEIEFPLPNGVAAADVEKSLLAVSGFYLRYSNTSPREDQVSGATLIDRAGGLEKPARASFGVGR